VVDAHVHFNEPGRTEWEGFAAGTAGAAAGGTTTVCDMPLNSLPPTLDGAAFESKRAALERDAIVDVALWGGATHADAPLEELRAAGAVGVKVFMSDSGVVEFPALDDAALSAILRRAGRLGLLVAVHAEDQNVLAAAAAPRDSAGALAWRASRPIEAEVRAVRRVLSLARDSGARVHVVHASCAAAVDEVVAARRAGVDATVETCPHYLVFDDAEIVRHDVLLKCAPPIRDDAERDRLWDRVRRGDIDLIASDHSPSSAALKSGDIWSAWGGVSGVQSLLPAMLTDAVHRRGMSLPSLARLLSLAPARRLGLAPRKGSIGIGADADLALIDLDREWVLPPSGLRARSGLSPYVGRTFRGAIVRTLVRGAAPRRGMLIRPRAAA
jgi:allantoinase